MKKLFPIFVLSLAGASLRAQIAYDPFANATGSGGTSYAVGSNLIGQTNAEGQTWFMAGPTGTQQQPIISSGNLSVSGLTPSTGNSVSFGGASGDTARLGLGSTNTSGTFYYSMALKLNALPGTGAAGAIVGAFNNSTGSQTTQPSAFGAALRVNLSGSSYVFGLDKSGAGAATSVFDTGLYNGGDTVFLVGSYTFVAGTANDSTSLWIDPSSTTFGAASAPTATLSISTGTDLSAIASFVLREANTTLPGLTVDDLRIGTDWADVTPPVTAAPEPGVIALMGLGCTGLFFARRNRR